MKLRYEVEEIFQVDDASYFVIFDNVKNTNHRELPIYENREDASNVCDELNRDSYE